jgi:hypothetical protein
VAIDGKAAGAVLRASTALIEALTRAAFERFLKLLGDGVDVPQAIAQAQAGFSGAFAEALAASFSRMLVRAVGTADVRAMPVAGVPLSRRLYSHAQQTSAEVEALVREYAAGVSQARDLALRLYDGYNPTDGIRRPLEGSARADLPKALRSLTTDPQTRASLTQLVEDGQKQAARMKSRALRAAYSEAFTAWVDDKGADALKRKLDNAMREKNRYFAERIARTELSRAYQAQVAQEFMADASIEVLQVRMSPTHPMTDICDMHARANLFGLGPGCYPKAKAPRPPYHPHCFCKLVSRPDLGLADAVEAERQTEAEFLRSLPKYEAAKVVGSKARLAEVQAGASVRSVVDRAKDTAYRTTLVGEGKGHALLENAAVSNAYEEAKKPGGRHSEWMRQQQTLGENQLRSAARSIQRQVALHEGWIADPASKVHDWQSLDPRYKRGLLAKWAQDARRQREQIDIVRGVLREKGFTSG